MSRIADLYAAVAREAGLDICEESTWDIVSDALRSTGLPWNAPAIDLFDDAVDILIARMHPELVG